MAIIIVMEKNNQMVNNNKLTPPKNLNEYIQLIEKVAENNKYLSSIMSDDEFKFFMKYYKKDEYYHILTEMLFRDALLNGTIYADKMGSASWIIIRILVHGQNITIPDEISGKYKDIVACIVLHYDNFCATH